MKSIRTKMMVFFGIIIGVVCIASGLTSYINSVSALESNLQVMLPEIAKQTAANIESRVQGELKALESVAARDDIKDPGISVQDKLKTLKEEGTRLGALKMGIISLEGSLLNDDGTTAQVKDRDYFQKAITGVNVVSDPLVTAENLLVVPYIVPIMNNGEVIGLLIETRDGSALSEITNSIKVGQNGSAFMINKEGVSIANPDQNKVLQKGNDIENAKTDKSLVALAEIEKKMIAGETGMGIIEYKGIEKFMGYAPIGETGWSIATTMTRDEALSVLDSLKSTDALSSVIFVLISLVLVYLIANSISKGIKLSSNHLKLLAEGNLTGQFSPKYLKHKDEIGEMTNSMKEMQEAIGQMIRNIRDTSSDINKQSEGLTSVTEEIAQASQNVTETITEVAKGTNNQSEELVLITDILEQFVEKLANMVREIQAVGDSSKEINVMATDSSDEMNLLNQSVIKVSQSFKEFSSKITSLAEEINQISEITSLINNIADQTNLLALNAAIEAARAGESGKGFAVVADEIRQLAEQSKVSSDNISKVIGNISESADNMISNSASMDNELLNQVTVIENSLTSFKKIIGAIDQIIPKIETVQVAALAIEEDKNKVMNGIEDISSVSMEVSASSEEISASSEEMSASAQEVASAASVLNQATTQMLEEVERFQI